MVFIARAIKNPLVVEGVSV